MKKKLIKKLDVAFSLVIRAKGKCEKCGNLPEYAQMHCSHIYSRRFMNTRWDEENAQCLCAKHHFWWHDKPLDAIEWLKTVRTPKYLKRLKEKANTLRKWTDKEGEELLKELKAKL